MVISLPVKPLPGNPSTTTCQPRRGGRYHYPQYLIDDKIVGRNYYQRNLKTLDENGSVMIY